MGCLVPLLLAAGLTQAAAAAPDAHRALGEEVAAAERAFDAHTAEHGFTAGFLAFAAPDGILFRPDPVNARAHLSAGPASTDTGLRWRPARIGVAASGDLAFDAGPWSLNGGQANGWFFTIWKRQPDGRWLWTLDHGSGVLPSPSQPEPEAPVRVIAAGRPHPGGAEAAWAEVLAAERALADAVREGAAAAAYAPWLAPDAWLATPDRGPAEGEAIPEALGRRPSGLANHPQMGGEASLAGDLAYIYGHATWSAGEDAAPRRGHYVRVWRRDADGWRIVYDQLTEAAPG